MRPKFGDDVTDRYDVIVGNAIVMECHVIVGDPPPIYTWVKKGQQLSGNEEGIDLTPDGRLRLEAALVTDSGRLKFVVIVFVFAFERERDPRFGFGFVSVNLGRRIHPAHFS